MVNKIKESRRIEHSRSTTVVINESIKMSSYSMTIPSNPNNLEWFCLYGNPSRTDRVIIAGIMESYSYLLGKAITTGEAIERLRCLRREYQAQELKQD